MDSNLLTGRPDDSWDEEMKRAYQRAKDEFDPEQCERDFLATKEWIPMEQVLAEMEASMAEIRALFSQEPK